MSARSWSWGVCTLGFVMLALLAPSRADEVIKLTHQGVERSAILYRSANPCGPQPLGIALHG